MIKQKVNVSQKIGRVENFRDLGGYRNQDGKILREGLVFRSDDLSKKDLELDYFIKDKGIKTIIDLRSSQEAKSFHFLNQNPYAYYAIPMKGRMNTEKEDILFHLYVDLLENQSKKIVQVFHLLARADLPLVFHCRAGKDRTGLISMLFLKLLKVDDNLVVNDYAESENNLSEDIEDRRKRLINLGISPVPDEVFQTKAKTMEKTLIYLKETYGTVEKYLTAKGLNLEEITAIEERILRDV